MNSPSLQAAWSESDKLVQIAFWATGKIETPLGLIAVNHPCLLLVRAATGGRLDVTASNPENAPCDVMISIAGKDINIPLPGGAAAGSSLTRQVPK